MSIKEVKSFECSICRKLHANILSANSCYVSCNKEQRREDAKTKRSEDWEKKMNQLRLEVGSICELKEAVVTHAKKHFGAVFEFTQFGLTFNDVSCGHGAPIGKKTNWSNRDRNEPTSYKGFRGHVEGKWLKNGRNKDNDTVDMFSGLFNDNDSSIVGIHTGTGHGGKDFGYDFYIFLDDFPKLKAAHEEFLELQNKSKDLEIQEAKQLEKISAKIDKICKADPVYLSHGWSVEDIEKQIADLQVERDRHSKAKWAIYHTYEDQVNESKDTSFPIADKYKYDKERLDKLQKIFNKWY